MKIPRIPRLPSKSQIVSFFKRQWVASLAIFLLLVMAFSNSGPVVVNNSGILGSSGSLKYAGSYDVVEESGYDMVASDSYTQSRSVASLDVIAQPEVIDSKIIKTGSLSLHVNDVRETAEAIDSLVLGWGGSVLNSSINRGVNSYNGSLEIRVPSEEFEVAMASLKDLALYVASERTNASDVTETYIDLSARLNNYEEEEEQYLSILDEAGTMTEILEVTRAISDVRYEIESIKSSLSYYDTRVAFSTINMSLSEDESVTTVNNKWRPGSTVSEAFASWVDWLQARADSVIYLAIFGWPVLLVLIAFVIWRRRKARRGEKPRR